MFENVKSSLCGALAAITGAALLAACGGGSVEDDSGATTDKPRPRYAVRGEIVVVPNFGQPPIPAGAKVQLTKDACPQTCVEVFELPANSAQAAYTFSTPLARGDAWTVSVVSPTSWECAFRPDRATTISGTVGRADVVLPTIDCLYKPVLPVGPQLRVSGLPAEGLTPPAQLVVQLLTDPFGSPTTALTVTANGVYSFGVPFPSQNFYYTRVQSPPGYNCTGIATVSAQSPELLLTCTPTPG